MNQHLALVTLLVRDYDEAIDFYINKLDFELANDKPLEESKRWVVVKPPGTGTASLLLAKASGDEQLRNIGNQTGNRVSLFLFTDNFWRDYERMISRGVHFKENPREEVYGNVAVFCDLYGNLWDLLEPKSP